MQDLTLVEGKNYRLVERNLRASWPLLEESYSVTRSEVWPVATRGLQEIPTTFYGQRTVIKPGLSKDDLRVFSERLDMVLRPCPVKVLAAELARLAALTKQRIPDSADMSAAAYTDELSE